MCIRDRAGVVHNQPGDDRAGDAGEVADGALDAGPAARRRGAREHLRNAEQKAGVGAVADAGQQQPEDQRGGRLRQSDGDDADGGDEVKPDHRAAPDAGR